MKKILLSIVLVFVTSLVFAALGETELINKLRFFPTEPVKMIMLDESAILVSHLVIYDIWNGYYFEVISADTTIAEGVWSGEKSKETPDSVLKRFKALYGEGQEWIPNNEKPDYMFREDHIFGIHVSTPNQGRNCVWVWTQLGGEITVDTLYRAWEATNKFMDETKKQTKDGTELFN